MAMATTSVAKRFSVKTEASVFKRLGRLNQSPSFKYHKRLGKENVSANYPVICKYWLEGRCTRSPCGFLHPDMAKPKYSWKRDPLDKTKQKVNAAQCINNTDVLSKKSELNQQKKVLTTKVYVGQTQSIQKNLSNTSEVKQQNMLTCEGDVGQSQSINCLKSKKNVLNVAETQSIEKNEIMQSWFSGNSLSVVAKLEGHTKAITGIVIPPGSNKLFCGSKDKSLQVWDCDNGQCGGVVNFNDECRTLVQQGPWIFAGLRNMIKAWNLETQTEVIIGASGGYVNVLIMSAGTLFAGMEDGNIMSWKSTSKTSFSEAATSSEGHTGSVLSLVIGAKRLFSGSADHTIRVWDCESLQCTDVLNGHTADVTAVLCWDQFLLSGSLDKTIKVWGETKSGNIEQVYKHDVDDGVLAFYGMHDAEEKPILLCSCKNNGVYLYDLPTFIERGRIYSGRDIQAIHVIRQDLFFTGDVAGLVTVWKPSVEAVCKAC